MSESTGQSYFTANPGTYTLAAHYSGNNTYAPADLPTTVVTIPGGSASNAPTLSVTSGQQPAVVNAGSTLLSTFIVGVNDATDGSYITPVHVTVSAVSESDPNVQVTLQTSSNVISVNSPQATDTFTLDAPTAGLAPGAYQLVYAVQGGTFGLGGSFTTIYSESDVTVTSATAPPADVPAVSRLSGATASAPVVAGVRSRGLSAVVTVPAAEAGTDTVAVYASATGDIDGSSKLLGTAHRRVSIKRGVTTAAVTVPLQAGFAPAGAYVLLARVTNPAGLFIDGAVGPVLTAQPPGVTLAASITKVAPATTFRVGSTFAFTLTLTNSGDVPTSGRAMLAISLANNFTTPTVPVRTLNPALTVRPGKPMLLRLTAKVPAATAAEVGDDLAILVQVTQGTAVTSSVTYARYPVVGR